MKIGEIFKGTQAERAAVTTVDKLTQKLNQGRPLSVLQQASLEDSLLLKKRLSRRRLVGGAVVGAGLAVTGGAVGLSFLGNDGDRVIDSTIPTQTPEQTVNTLEEWRGLSAQDRLQRMFTYKTPELEGFDDTKETIIATAQFYTEQVPSQFSAEDLISRTTVVATKKEYAELGLNSGNIIIRDPSKVEKAKEEFSANSRGFTVGRLESFDNRQVLVNEEKIRLDIVRGISGHSRFAEYGKQRNIYAEFIYGTLVHEYGHMNQSSEVANVPTVSFDFADGVLVVDRIHGLRPGGFIKENVEMFVASDEALVDAQALVLDDIAGNTSRTLYPVGYDASPWVLQLNASANISSWELFEYVSGERKINDLLHKWGSLDKTVETDEEKIRKGVLLYFIIGLVSSRAIDTQLGKRFMEEILSSRN